jgi:hypothetical protein
MILNKFLIPKGCIPKELSERINQTNEVNKKNQFIKFIKASNLDIFNLQKNTIIFYQGKAYCTDQICYDLL